MNKAIAFALFAATFVSLTGPGRSGETSSPLLLAQAEVATEQADWEKVVESTNPDDFFDFIAKHPNGVFRSTAEAQIKRLYRNSQNAAPAAAAPAAPAAPPAAAASQDGIRVVPGIAAPPQAEPVVPAELSAEAQEMLALRTDTQRELARIGCFGGNVDGRWDTRSSEGLRIYARKKGIVLPSWDPTTEVLERLIVERGEICSAPACLITEVSRNGKCVEKACPSGEQVSADGKCGAAVQAVVAPAPPAPMPAPPQLTPAAPEAPAAAALPVAPAPAPAAPAAVPAAIAPPPAVVEQPAQSVAPKPAPKKETQRKAVKPARDTVKRAPPPRVEPAPPRREAQPPRKRKQLAPCSAAVKGLPEYDHCE